MPSLTKASVLPLTHLDKPEVAVAGAAKSRHAMIRAREP